MTVTELTPYQPQTAALVDYQTRAVQRLGEWVHSADAAYTVAERLVQSSFVPAAFRGKPIEATAAILAGAEVGLSPMASLRSFDIIQGQAAPRAITLRAIVQSFGHEIVLAESTATRCIMRGRRRGTTEWQRSVWTIDRAKDMQLTGKDNWKKQPGAMLVARATSEIARLIAADAILGIGYTAEEIADGADPAEAPAFNVPAETVEAPPATRRMSRAKPTPAPEYEPSGLDEFAKPEMITEPQSKKLHAQFGDLGLQRDQALDWIAEVIGHTITTTKELTKAEASQVIDRNDEELLAANEADAHEAEDGDQ